MQVVLGLGFIARVFQTDTEQYSGKLPVQLFLGMSIAFFTFMYEFFQTQICWYWCGYKGPEALFIIRRALLYLKTWALRRHPFPAKIEISKVDHILLRTKNFAVFR